MDKNRHSQLLLEKLKVVMHETGLWESVAPSQASLASTEPFAVDTLTCNQWLQWIFIPKMTQLVTMQQPLPAHFELSPYVEEAMKHNKGVGAIIRVTRELDNLFKAQ
ncbi:YqcC family protein [Photobacterium lipolyticum]|uniref:Pseudouridine synthase n=1 Tax=Photobacterium lipolyticum TaxID=266810 RepID=A0A2T3MSY6_9GAMM|nr:YqcC family protein [Photobacterium lipolyticum]PSW01686.1 pseudouridine synthase [Photobacterium lipolyticum]